MNLSEMTFLIVDDQEAVISYLETTLLDNDAKDVIPAYNGAEAWEYLQNNKDRPVDFIICDYDMPQMNGAELLKAVRADSNYASTPFLMLTSHSNFKIIAEIVSFGADNYLLKPPEDATLFERINSCIEKRKR